jgi:hypothetical protein
MLQIFIDESGDLGMNDGYFIIAMLVAYDSKRIKNLVKNFCAENGREEIHAYDLNFVQKQDIINKLTKQTDYNVSYIVADKMMINKKELFSDNNLLFNYLFSFLVKDVFRADTDDIYLYLDNRTQKVASINSLRDYIKIKAYFEWGFTKNMTVEYVDSKMCKAVQMVDLIANSVRRKYVHGQVDFYNRLHIIKSIKFPKNTFRASI